MLFTLQDVVANGRRQMPNDWFDLTNNLSL